MSDNCLDKIILVIMYLAIFIMIPFFLDYLFKITVRKKRKQQIKYLAKNKAIKKNKALIIFNNRYQGVVINYNGDKLKSKEEFTGDIIEIIEQMADNSCVIIISETFEYINKQLSQIIQQIQRVSGDDLYTVNFEKTSPRIFWDYKIKNVMDKSFYLPGDNITWSKPNKLQANTQKFYSFVFKFIPYNLFANISTEKIEK